MRQLSAEKYSVAWFKLAEFIMRGEKERALGLYRLLIHSFEDEALAYQLEGDILLAFRDPVAEKKYEAAAHLYDKQQRVTEAIAMYEQLLLHKPESHEYLKRIIFLHQQVGHMQKAALHIKTLATNYLKSQNLQALFELLDEAKKSIDVQERTNVYKSLLQTSITGTQKSLEVAAEYAVDDLILQSNETLLQQLLEVLRERNAQLYAHLHNYVNAP